MDRPVLEAFVVLLREPAQATVPEILK